MAMKTCDILFEPANRLAVVDVCGAATIPCLIQAFIELGTHADWDSNFDVLILVGDGPSLETFTLTAMKELQAFMREWNSTNRTGSNPRTAIICPDGLKRVIAELWAAMNDTGNWPVEIGVFITRPQADAWLAQEPGQGQVPGLEQTPSLEPNPGRLIN